MPRHTKQFIYMYSGSAAVTNGIATVTIDSLACEVEYAIIAGGTLDGDLVGPRLSHGTITVGHCPQVMTTTTSPATATTMTGKKNIVICNTLRGRFKGLMCKATYTIIAGTLNGDSRSSHGTTTGPCPPMIITTTTAATSMIGKELELPMYTNAYIFMCF